MADAEERRDKILRDYHELTHTLPNLPAQLRDFQVKEMYIPENCFALHLKIFRLIY